MTNKQFNLSKHITNKSHSSGNIPVVRVKEFIRLLKEEIKNMSVDDSLDCYDNCNYMDFERTINKLAGDKLVK